MISYILHTGLQLNASADDTVEASGVTSSTLLCTGGFFPAFADLGLSPIEKIKPQIRHTQTHVTNPPTTTTPIIIKEETPACCSPNGFWKKDLALFTTDKDALMSGEWLTDKHINAAQSLLRKQFPSQNGLQDTLVLEHTGEYNSQSEDFVQVLHVSGNHWVCASNLFAPEGCVDVYDSMPAYSYKCASLEQQLAVILKCKEPSSFSVRHINVQRQVGGSSCGLYAVAFAVSLCLGVDPYSATYNQAEMRKHLCQCIESNAMSLFPSAKKSRRLARVKVLMEKPVHVYCYCRLPWNPKDTKRGALVECNTCKQWFHEMCCNIASSVIKDSSKIYQCDNCSV